MYSLHLLTSALWLALLAACAPAPTTPSNDARQVTGAALPETAIAPPAQDTGTGPDDVDPELPPDGYHGNWRLVAADDPHDQALMAISIQSSAGEPEGSGDFVLFQPFCDAVADAPISGTTDCELIDMTALFDRVQATPERIVLSFHPTADGIEHRLELQRAGTRLTGDYVIEGHLRRPVLATRNPADTP